MPYLIDGHNLIPKLGLRLEDPDDEMELTRILQEFARIKRQPVEVYFDGAPPRGAGTRKIGTVKAHFIRRGQTADSAIRARVDAMGGAAKNWTVVSSDREVQGWVKSRRARCLSSEEFVNLVRTTLIPSAHGHLEDKAPSAQEVEDWLRLFGEK
jgi:predicted RNA-binding protein with PIN domain